VTDRLVSALEDHARVVAAIQRTLLPEIQDAARRLVACFRAGGKLLAMGNGGSAADAQHLVAELVGRYRRERRPIPAIALTVDPSITTAVSNDYGFDEVFARQVRAHARAGDVVLGISTSGNSENVVRGLRAARELGATTLALTGATGGRLRELADCALLVPSTETPRIQEGHVTIIHLLCDLVDDAIGGDDPR